MKEKYFLYLKFIFLKLFHNFNIIMLPFFLSKKVEDRRTGSLEGLIITTTN